MLMQEIRAIAQKVGVKPGKLKKTELIRAIQLAEGNFDCFDTPIFKECDQVSCLWRGDCLEPAQPAATKPAAPKAKATTAKVKTAAAATTAKQKAKPAVKTATAKAKTTSTKGKKKA